MTETSAITCSLCRVTIPADDLTLGLAVRVNGEPVCAQCVDTLPGDAQVQINQIRAMRGLSSITYLVPFPKLPRLQLFTFTTVGNVAFHRRKFVQDGFYEAPTLPPPQERKPLEMARPPSATTTPRHQPHPAAKSNTPVIAGVVIGVLVIGVLLLALFSSPPQTGTTTPPTSPTATPTSSPPPPRVTTPKPSRTRFDYSVDPAQGWIQAQNDRDCPDFVRQTITQELRDKRVQQLDEAEQALADRRLEDATRLANALSLPEDISFRDLRTREQDLRTRLLSSRTRTPPTTPETPPPPPGPGETPRAGTTATPPAPPATPTPPATAQALSDCWLFPGKDLLVGNDTNEWSRRDASLVLKADGARIQRGCMLASGLYQVWVHAHCPDDGSLLAAIGPLKAQRLDLKAGAQPAWMQLYGDNGSIFNLPGGECVISLTAIGKGWEIGRVFIADVGKPGPEWCEAQHLAAAPKWGASFQATAVDAPGVTVWKPLFVQGGGERPVKALTQDGSMFLPPAWPGGSDGFFRSVLTRTGAKRRHGMTLDLGGKSALNGGLVLLAHRTRYERKKLLATLTDGAGKTLALAPLEFTTDSWTPFIIPVDSSGDFNPKSLGRLVLQDAENLEGRDEDAGFLIARLVIVANRPPLAKDLGLRPPALVRDDNRLKDLPRLLEAVFNVRKRPWQRNLDPGKLKILVGQRLKGGWISKDLRERLDILLPGKLPPKDPERWWLQDLVFAETQLDNLFKEQNPETGIDRNQHHVVFIATGGSELLPGGAGQTAAQVLDAFWQKRIMQFIQGGVIPVVVLGPNRVDLKTRPEADRLWTDLQDFVAKRQLGIPVIDLRSVPVNDNGETYGGSDALAAQLMIDGYTEFIHNLRRVGATK